MMSRHLVVVPMQTSVRHAVRLLHRVQASEAPVVDEHGRCVGVQSPADVFRWVGDGCPETVVGPVPTCPYQVRGRLLTGVEAVICTLADGSCLFQEVLPTTGGRHADVCMRQRAEHPPFGTVPSHMTSAVVTARPETPVLELALKITDDRADRLVVLDESDRPVGIVSATDVLRVVADGRGHANCSGEVEWAAQ
jgi:CBS-domain-containing membrane protein